MSNGPNRPPTPPAYFAPGAGPNNAPAPQPANLPPQPQPGNQPPQPPQTPEREINNIGLELSLVFNGVRRVATAARARNNERIADNQADRQVLGASALRLLEYTPADPLQNREAAVTHRLPPHKKGILRELHNDLRTARSADNKSGVGLANRAKARIMARRINKARTTHVRRAEQGRQSLSTNKNAARILAGRNRRVQRRYLKEIKADPNVSAADKSLIHNFVHNRGQGAEQYAPVIAFQREVNNRLGRTRHNATRPLHETRKAERRNRPGIIFKSRTPSPVAANNSGIPITRKEHLGERYHRRLIEESDRTEVRANRRAERLRQSVDDTYRRSRGLKTYLERRRGLQHETYGRVARLHGHTIHPRPR